MADRLTSQNGRFELVMHDDGRVGRYDFARQEDTTVVPAPPPGPEPEPEPEPIPGPRPPVRFPGKGASYYTSMTDPDVDVPTFARFLRDTGCTFTRVWLLDAWARGDREPDGSFVQGQYAGLQPVRRTTDDSTAPFDLWDWNTAYFEQLRRYTDTLNAYGVWPHFTLLELYTWSARKAGLPFVPDPEQGPWRRNVNGIRWGDPDDPTFFTLPDVWMQVFIDRVLVALTGTAFALEVGNEMPEKGLHERHMRYLRNVGYAGELTCNRQIDSPGQPWNMHVGGAADDWFTRIAFHGKLHISYLDEMYPDEVAQGRPSTFREMWGEVDPARVIISSDGGGGNPALHSSLTVVAQDALDRGGSYEHQLALKRNRFYGDGTLRMEDLEIDRAFLAGLRV